MKFLESKIGDTVKLRSGLRNWFCGVIVGWILCQQDVEGSDKTFFLLPVEFFLISTYRLDKSYIDNISFKLSNLRSFFLKKNSCYTVALPKVWKKYKDGKVFGFRRKLLEIISTTYLKKI